MTIINPPTGDTRDTPGGPTPGGEPGIDFSPATLGSSCAEPSPLPSDAATLEAGRDRIGRAGATMIALA